MAKFRVRKSISVFAWVGLPATGSKTVLRLRVTTLILRTDQLTTETTANVFKAGYFYITLIAITQLQEREKLK